MLVHSTGRMATVVFLQHYNLVFNSGPRNESKEGKVSGELHIQVVHHTVQSNHIVLFCHRIFRAGGAGTAGTAGAVPLFTLYANLNSACSARRSGHGIKTRAARCCPIDVQTAYLYSWRKFLIFQISPITLGVYCFPTNHLERLLSLIS